MKKVDLEYDIKQSLCCLEVVGGSSYLLFGIESLDGNQ